MFSLLGGIILGVIITVAIIGGIIEVLDSDKELGLTHQRDYEKLHTHNWKK